MAKSIGIYKCQSCEEQFEAESGSMTYCPCGESGVRPNNIGSGFSYPQNTKEVKVITQKEYLYPEVDVITLSERAEALLKKIKIAAEPEERPGYTAFEKYKFCESHKKMHDDSKMLSNISIERFEMQDDWKAHTEVKLEIKLTTYLNTVDMADIEMRLEKFHRFMLDVNTGNIDIKKVGDMKDLAYDQDLSYDAEQVEEYNYTFNF